MYINSNANVATINSSKHLNAHHSAAWLNPPQTHFPPVSSETVTISSEARQLAKMGADKAESTQLPNVANMPKIEDNIEKYVALHKARMKYQVVSDMTNIAMGNSEGISAPTAHYLSNNAKAMAASINHLAYQQQIDTMQTAVNASNTINEWA